MTVKFLNPAVASEAVISHAANMLPEANPAPDNAEELHIVDYDREAVLLQAPSGWVPGEEADFRGQGPKGELSKAAREHAKEENLKLYSGNKRINPSRPRGRAITLNQAKKLRHGQIIYMRSNLNADGTAVRWRVTGTPKVWVRSPERVSVPLKHGMRHYGHLTEDNLSHFTLKEPPQVKKGRKRNPSSDVLWEKGQWTLQAIPVGDYGRTRLMLEKTGKDGWADVIDYPTHYGDGKMGYDRPEVIPKSVQKAVSMTLVEMTRRSIDHGQDKKGRKSRNPAKGKKAPIYRYHVTGPRGGKYLTSTFDEARALTKNGGTIKKLKKPCKG